MLRVSMLQAPSPLYAHYEHPVSIMRRCCEYTASTITVIYAHYEHPASIMCRCCEYVASTITHIRMLNIFDKLMFIILIYETLQIEKIHLLTFYLLNIYSFQFTTTVNFQIVGSYFLCF